MLRVPASVGAGAASGIDSVATSPTSHCDSAILELINVVQLNIAIMLHLTTNNSLNEPKNTDIFISTQ